MSHSISHPTFLTIVRGPRVTPPTDFPITEELTTIGRHPGCDIVLDDITVSRWHAELELLRPDDEHGRALVLTDLGSLNGTYVNRNPVDTALLSDGDTVWIGAYRLLVHTSPAHATGQPPWPATPAMAT